MQDVRVEKAGGAALGRADEFDGFTFVDKTTMRSEAPGDTLADVSEVSHDDDP
jgi:hypothetical protein